MLTGAGGRAQRGGMLSVVQCRAESAPFALQVGWSGEAELQGWLPQREAPISLPSLQPGAFRRGLRTQHTKLVGVLWDIHSILTERAHP